MQTHPEIESVLNQMLKEGKLWKCPDCQSVMLPEVVWRHGCRIAHADQN